MWRYLVGAVGALMLAGAAVLLFKGQATPPHPLLALASGAATTDATEASADVVPEALARTREQERFDRYDKDRDGKITREEYLASRRKAYAKLDTNHDGVLQFDEWATKSEAKFANADADRGGTLTREEFATTAVKRKPRAPRGCPPGQRGDATPPAKADDEG